MSRETRRNCLIIIAASMLAAAAAGADGAEPTGRIDRAEIQAELAPLSVDARALAANVGRALTDRALAVTHCITIRPQLKLAAARTVQTDRS